MRLTFPLFIFIVGTAGCASVINDKEAINYEKAGVAAQARGDWAASREAYARAAHNADLANSNPRRRGIIHYEYGRTLGATCFFDDAERELNLAYEFDRVAGQPLYLSLVELARLNFDQKNFTKSASYFDKAFLELDRVNAAKEAPIAYADILDEYASALSGSGRKGDAETATKKASIIRGTNPKNYSITDRTPYGKYCSKS